MKNYLQPKTQWHYIGYGPHIHRRIPPLMYRCPWAPRMVGYVPQSCFWAGRQRRCRYPAVPRPCARQQKDAKWEWTSKKMKWPGWNTQHSPKTKKTRFLPTCNEAKEEGIVEWLFSKSIFLYWEKIRFLLKKRTALYLELRIYTNVFEIRCDWRRERSGPLRRPPRSNLCGAECGPWTVPVGGRFGCTKPARNLKGNVRGNTVRNGRNIGKIRSGRWSKRRDRWSRRKASRLSRRGRRRRRRKGKKKREKRKKEWRRRRRRRLPWPFLPKDPDRFCSSWWREGNCRKRGNRGRCKPALPAQSRS